MQNQQADFAEIRRIRHVNSNFPWNLCSRLASQIAALWKPPPLTAKNPNVTVARIYVEVRKMRIP
jgi:hypothetical protein